MIAFDNGFDIYPFLIILGLLLGFFLLNKYFEKKNMPKGLATKIEICITISTIVGVICACLFQNLYNFIENPTEFEFSLSMTLYGGIIGGFATFFLIYFLYLKRKNPPFLKELLCVGASGVAFAHSIGRIGCFLDGCCYGKETDSIFGIKFVTTQTKVWPTNLFEAIFVLILAFILLYLAFKKDSIYTFPIYMISYSIFRFFIEFLRGDHRGSFIPGITPSQFWSILLFVGGVVSLIYCVKKSRLTKSA